MSQNECLERGSRQGQRRKHHRYSGPDHFYNNSRAHLFQHYDGLNASRFLSGPVQSEGRQHDCRPLLDELALEHMTQDCTLLKNQLLRLKTLLQLEETDSSADVSVETEENTTATQVNVLIKEVQTLKEELRSRDNIIAQLTSQCQQLRQQHLREQMPHQGRQVRCQCQHQRASSSLRQSERQTDKRTQHHYDKATQTYWRPPSHAPQILQPFNPCLSEHPRQGRVVRTPPTEGRSEVAKSRSEEATHVADDRPPEALVADALGAAGSDELSHLPSTNLHGPGSGAPQGITARDGPASAAQSAAQPGWRAPAVMMRNSITPKSAGSTCFRMLQPPCLHKRVSLPASKPGGTAGFASLRLGCSSGPPANPTKQLPPPSRGLPCFNTGPQLHTPKLCPASLLQPLRTSEPKRDLWCTKPSSLEEPTLGSVKFMNSFSRSSLPKPKVP